MRSSSDKVVGLVGVDGDSRWLGGRYYLNNVVEMLAQNANQHHWVARDIWWRSAPEVDPFAQVRHLLGQRAVLDFPRGLFARGVRKAMRMLRHGGGAGDLLRRAGVHVVFPSPPFAACGTPLLFWVPDFQHLHFPALFGADGVAAMDEHYRVHVEQAAHVVLSSYHALRDFRSCFPTRANDATVVSFAVVPEVGINATSPRDVAVQHGLPERYVIVSNQFSSHKNHLILFEAIRVLRDRGIAAHLACTGSRYNWLDTAHGAHIDAYIRGHKLEGQVHLLGVLPRPEQLALMRRACAVLQPSLFEGWSSSVEEARALGRPLLASDIEVHREQVAGTKAKLLPVDSAEAWAGQIEAALAQPPGPDQGAEHAGLTEARARQRTFGTHMVAALERALERGVV